MLVNFISLLLWIKAENRTKLSTKSGGTQHHKHANCASLFIRKCNNVSDILDWTWFLIAGIHSTTNLKFINKQKSFFNPENTQSSFEKTLKEKRHKFISMCSTFTSFNMQILRLCHRWHRRIHNPLEYLK